jgi:hypothetical protein
MICGSERGVGVGPRGVGVDRLKNEAEQAVSVRTMIMIIIFDFIFYPPGLNIIESSLRIVDNIIKRILGI